MESHEAASAALQHIRERLVLPVGASLDKFASPEVVWRWRNDTLTLDHFVRAHLDAACHDQVAGLLNTSASLWRLLNEHADALDEIEDYKLARLLDVESSVVSIAEEFLTGEDQGIRDILVNGLSFFLGWKSNTVWVDSVKKLHRSLPRNYLPEIQSELWEFLRLTSTTPTDDMTLDHARDLGERMEKVLELLAAASLPTNAQVVLLTFLYHWMLRLRVGKLIVSLEGVVEADNG